MFPAQEIFSDQSNSTRRQELDMDVIDSITQNNCERVWTRRVFTGQRKYE
jgi:hypothetical protein